MKDKMKTIEKFCDILCQQCDGYHSDFIRLDWLAYIISRKPRHFLV